MPDLAVDEFKRERKFYSERGLPCPKDQALEQESEEKRAAEAEAAMTPDANTNMDFHRFDEQVRLIPTGCNEFKANLILLRSEGFLPILFSVLG